MPVEASPCTKITVAKWSTKTRPFCKKCCHVSVHDVLSFNGKFYVYRGFIQYVKCILTLKFQENNVKVIPLEL